MDGSPSSVISLGFGSWGSIGLVVTLGFGVGEASVAGPDPNETGLEFRTDANRLHFRTDKNRLHFRPEVGRLHFRPEVIR